MICQNGVALRGIYRIISKVISKCKEGKVHLQCIPSEHKSYCLQQHSRLEVPDILLPQTSKTLECHTQTVRTLNQLKSYCSTLGKFGGTTFMTTVSQCQPEIPQIILYYFWSKVSLDLMALKGTRACLSLERCIKCNIETEGTGAGHTSAGMKRSTATSSYEELSF